MKKKILLAALAIIGLFATTGCGNGSKLDAIAKKINNCESVKNYREYDYIINASATEDTLTITGKMDETQSKVEFKLNGDILSNENLSTSDLMAALLLINGVGQTYGYKDGELTQNINAFTEEFQKYTLDKEGLELIIGADKVSLKIDLSKKIPLIDMNKFYLKTEDFDMISELVETGDTGNQSGRFGNISYDVFVGENESTIQIGQDGKLSDSAYKSLISALEVMYGEDVSKHFQDIYPQFVDGKKVVEAFTIETNYKVEDQEETVFKGTKVVLVTINNSELK